MENETTTSVSVLGTRDAWWYGAMAYIGFIALAFAVATLIEPMIALVGIASMFGTGGVFVWGPLVLAWMRWKKLAADPQMRNARASRAGLFVDGKVSLPRDLIRAAYVSPSWPNGAYLRVERTLGLSTELWTHDVESAHALVRALSLDAQRVIANIGGSSFATREYAWIVHLFVVATSVWYADHWHAPVLIPLAILACVLAGAMPTRFVIGTDGVLVTWFGVRQGFVPIESIREVEQKPGVVRLHFHDGTKRDLVVARWVGLGADAVGLRVGMVAERIRDAMRRAGTLVVDTSALVQGGEDARAWIDRLRTMTAGAGYRAALQREDLVYVLGDARQPPKVRIAAAIALGELGTEEKTRLRIAADSSSMPEVRDAFEAVLEADEEEVLDCMNTL
ncbi:MAG: hypothetical protein ACXVEE_33510 [Polyangiales bacterium]